MKTLRIYQILTYTFGALLLFITHNQLNSEFAYDRLFRSADFYNEINKGLLYDSKTDKMIDPEDVGEIVCSAECAHKYEQFLERKRKDIFYSVDKQTHGYYFGINEFINFSDSVKWLIDNHPEPPVGVRVFKCISQLDSDGIRYFDAFIVPQKTMDPPNNIRGRKKLLESVDDYNFALNTSWPCPDMCDPEP